MTFKRTSNFVVNSGSTALFLFVFAVRNFYQRYIIQEQKGVSEAMDEFSAPDGRSYSDYQDNDSGNMMDSMYEEIEEQELMPYNAANSYDSDSESRNIENFTVEEYIGDLQAKAGAARPQSAPAGKRGLQMNEVVSETFTPHNDSANPKLPFRLSPKFLDSEIHIAESVKLPSSPYDEEVAFEYLPEDDEDLDSAYLDSRKRHSSTTTGYTSNNTGSVAVNDEHWVEENRRYLMASATADIPAAPASNLRPRPSSADPRLRQSASSTGLRSSSTGRFGTSFNSTAFATRQGRHSLPDPSSNAFKPRSSSTDRARLRLSSARTSTERLGAMKELVEDLVRCTAKKADMYHMIQVR